MDKFVWTINVKDTMRRGRLIKVTEKYIMNLI